MIFCLDRLLSLPEVFHRIERGSTSPESSLEEVARLISNDPALSIRLLHVANSAIFGFPSRITTVTRAVQLLGLRQVRGSVAGDPGDQHFRRSRRQGTRCGAYWRASVLRAGERHRARARKGGMSESSGCSCSACLPTLATWSCTSPFRTKRSAPRNWQARASSPAAPRRARDDRLRPRRGRCGAALAVAAARQFRARAVANQFEPKLAGSGAREASIVYRQPDRSGRSRRRTSAQVIEECDPTVWGFTNVEPDEFQVIRATAELGLAATLAVFFPR